mmetsp:Transcript_17249/g.25496  ORF Transcript_17249/g.25496 Transcript_17249/m.25496 type:complete len:677 (-) Transcript_17249:436-2466(-)
MDSYRKVITVLAIILFWTISCLDSANAFTVPASIKNHFSTASPRLAAGRDSIPPTTNRLNVTSPSSFKPTELDGKQRKNYDDSVEIDSKAEIDVEQHGLLLLESTLDDAEAILEVSKEAAAVAEASLPESVADSIPLIPVAEKKSATTIDFPSIKRIIVFTVSASGVFWCSPLLSLIDTSAVGLLSGTAQQAALNPATAMTDYAAMLMAFLYTGATNTLASSQQKDSGDPEKPKTTVALIAVMQLSAYVGTALGCSLFVFARPLLRTLIGNDSISAEVFNAALKYVRIRAIGMPAAAIIGSTQAGCLGMQDIKSPLYVLGAAALVNFLGDCLLVRLKYSLFGGAAGAAWATILSQYVAVGLFVRRLCSKPTRPLLPEKKNKNISKAILELTGDDNSDSKGKGRRAKFLRALKTLGPNEKRSVKTKQESYSSRGLLAGKFKGSDLFKFPKAKKAKKFAPFVIPVTTTQFGRVSAYIAMSHVVSSALGTAAMAAHQVVLSFFWCLAPIADSLSLTAQSIMPTISERTPSKERAAALKKTVRNFLKAGVLLSFSMVSAVLCVPFLVHLFTADQAVVLMVNSLVPILCLYFSTAGLFCAGEGMLLGQKDLSFVGRAYALFFVAVPACMLRVKQAALAGNPSMKLSSVWKVFCAYQYVRSATFVGRALLLQRRTEAEAEKL